MKHTYSLVDLLLNEIGNECPVAATRQGGSLSAFAASLSSCRKDICGPVRRARHGHEPHRARSLISTNKKYKTLF
jgi:hypothetical protein